MIARILEEGSFDVPATAIPAIDQLYGELVEAVTTGDDDDFRVVVLHPFSPRSVSGHDQWDPTASGHSTPLLAGKHDSVDVMRVQLGARTGLTLSVRSGVALLE